MYLKRLLAFLCCFTLVFCLFPSSAFATGGNGNIDGGGGSMGHGTSSNFWNSGNDGVRITVVDASSGTAVSSPLDFSNRTQKTSLLHFGKVNKLQYLGGAGLSLQSGVAYSCIRPTQSMPTIVSSKGQSNIEAIKRYFCSEYACMMVAQAAGVDYERMIAGEYKLLIEPIAYFTHNGQYYCMTATEAGLYDQMSGGNLRKTMTSLTHKNLPLSMFLEFSDLGISAWTGSTTGKQNNSDIISTLGVGIVWFDEAPPEGEIEAPDVEYRVDTDVITAVTLRTDQDLTPDNPASVTFHILGTTYRVNDIVIPAGDSQVVWVKWHTPSTPQTVTITVSVSGAYTAQDTFVAKIVDLNEHIPPDPVATDTNPGYSVPPLPSETQKLTANWGVWSCYWVPVWVWCDHGEDGGHWVDEGYWEYEYTGYSASISGEMSLMPDDIVPTASGKTMKSGYGVKTEVRATLSTDAPTSHITYPQTAFSVFPEFQYQTYLRLLQRSGGQSAKFIFKPNEFSTYDRTVHFTPLWFPDATDYTIYTQVWDTWTPDGMLSIDSHFPLRNAAATGENSVDNLLRESKSRGLSFLCSCCHQAQLPVNGWQRLHRVLQLSKQPHRFKMLGNYAPIIEALCCAGEITALPKLQHILIGLVAHTPSISQNDLGIVVVENALDIRNTGVLISGSFKECPYLAFACFQVRRGAEDLTNGVVAAKERQAFILVTSVVIV